jgi:chromosome segregation ATPase
MADNAAARAMAAREELNAAASGTEGFRAAISTQYRAIGYPRRNVETAKNLLRIATSAVNEGQGEGHRLAQRAAQYEMRLNEIEQELLNIKDKAQDLVGEIATLRDEAGKWARKLRR